MPQLVQRRDRHGPAKGKEASHQVRSARSRTTIATLGPDTPEYRAGVGTPLLLIHGANVTWRAWKPVLAQLEAHHDVIAFTLAGHSGGPSMDEGTPPTIQAFVDDLIDRLDRLELGTVHVAGNSLGGWIALELARRGRARSVVVFSPGGAWRSQLRYCTMTIAAACVLAMLDALGARADRLAHRPMGRRLLGLMNCQHPELLDPAELIADLRALQATPGLRLLMPTIGQTPLPPLPDPGCRVRVVWPVRDRLLPFRHFGQPLLERLPTAELVVLDGVGHVPMIDDPGSVAELILEVTSAVDREFEGGDDVEV